MSFVCDVQDLETARVIAQALLNGLPKDTALLAACNLRLSRHCSDVVGRLARETVIALTTVYPTSEPKRPATAFMELPAELRRKILISTDLVAPKQEVEWNAASQIYYVRYRKSLYLSDIDHREYSGEGWLEPCWRASSSSGCFCQAQHAAWSSEFPCNCWRRPTAFFLVSRGFREDAMQVFFRHNRFVITPNPTPWADGDTPTRLPASVFLADVVPKEHLKDLRSLDLVLPSLGKIDKYCPSNSQARMDWIRTLDGVIQELDLSKLVIRVTFACWHPGSSAGYGTFEEVIPKYRRSRGEEHFQLVRQSYIDTVDLLARFQGLKGFFVHLPHPYEYSRAYYDDMTGHGWEHTCRKRDERLQEMEVLASQIEKGVMGNDYDARLAGKADLQNASWQFDYVRFCSEL